MRQPLLLSRAKAKKQNTLPQAAPQAGQQSPQANIICLVPELCYMTGLSDDMRSDNMLKKVPIRFFPTYTVRKLMTKMNLLRI